MFKKMLIGSLCALLSLSGIKVIHAEEEQDVKSPDNKIESKAGDQKFLEDLNADGYAELGRYKVEKLKDNIYHWDEGTRSLPGGATDGEGNMNNPSSMYFIVDEDGVILVDLGNGSKDPNDLKNAKTIVKSMVGTKPLTILLTHNHGDHVGFASTDVSNIFDDVNVEKVYISTLDYNDDAKKALKQFVDANKMATVNDGDKVIIYGHEYEFTVVSAHTEGSLMIKDATHKALITGDTFGSGFIWALFETNNGNPLAALNEGLVKARAVMNEIPDATILAGHRWQQFDASNPERPNEMTIQYFNDMAQVISGLLNGTTITKPYDVVTWAPDAIELSSNGAKAKIDTLPKYVEAYKKSVTNMQEAFVYSASDKLSIDSINSNAAPVFVVYPDGNLTDDEALQFIKDSGIQTIVDRSASKVYIAKPSNNVEFTEADVQRFEEIVKNIGVSANFKLIGVGNGATFINQYLTGYMNFVSGLALINPEAGKEVNVSVPTYLVTDNQAVIDTYTKANKATLVSDNMYQNPNSRYEIVVVNSDTSISAVDATKEAWDRVLNKFGRIGNYSEVYKETATWYSRPLLSGNTTSDQARKYQYFDSIDSITNMQREVVTYDLDGNGIKSLWYEYIPNEVANAEAGTVPVVMLLHGNTNDPRTQYDTSGWAHVASEEGVILICPEWQGHTFQGYTYDPMTTDDNETPDSDMIKMLEMIEEKYPQIDKSRVYLSGLSRGSINTTNAGLSDVKYFAAGAGHSGPFGASEVNKQQAELNKDQYDMPIIFFTGDGDEYCKDAFDANGDNAGLQVAQVYQLLNDMEVTRIEDINPDDSYLYGVPWTTRYTIEPTEENIAKMNVGVIENDKGIEISMARIYGWGHWNYSPDAQMMWDFMSRYARDLETGESIRLDKLTPEVPTDPSEPDVEVPEEGEVTTPDPVESGDKTSITSLMAVAGLSLVALTGALVLNKKRKS